MYRFAVRHAGAFKWLLLLAWALALAGAFAGAWRLRRWEPALVLSIIALAVVAGWARWQRDRLIRESPLPQFLKRKLRSAYPHLSQKDADLVERGLRQFFIACSRSRGRFVAMPSRVVDAMWHEFILHTLAYRDWCQLVLGRFLHHTPAEVLGARAPHNDGLRRAWFWSCKDEAINPRMPTRLPLLFALDGKLGIENGFRYVPDCRGVARADVHGDLHCATAFSDGSFGGDADGFGGEASGGDGADGGDGGGDGDGGGGCGGGGD